MPPTSAPAGLAMTAADAPRRPPVAGLSRELRDENNAAARPGQVWIVSCYGWPLAVRLTERLRGVGWCGVVLESGKAARRLSLVELAEPDHRAHVARLKAPYLSPSADAPATATHPATQDGNVDCHAAVDCTHCYRCSSCVDCVQCSDCRDCRDCTSCSGVVGGRGLVDVHAPAAHLARGLRALHA